MRLFLLLLTLVSAGPPIQMRSYEFELKTSGRPDLFSHDVYIYSYEECREKASIIDNSILRNLTGPSSPHGCYLSADATPPTIYWNPNDSPAYCSSQFRCVVGRATSVDTFFYGRLSIKNVSDLRQTQKKFDKQFFDATPTVLESNTELVRQDDCYDHCDPAFNNPYTDGSCQSWNAVPSQRLRALATESYVSNNVEYSGTTCSGDDDCKTKCSADNSCMGYSKYDVRDDSLAWLESAVHYTGTNCLNDADCKAKCIADSNCQGYTEYWWPVLGDDTQTDTDEVASEFCDRSLLSRIYDKNHQFEDSASSGYSIATRDYSPRTTDSTRTSNTQGCQILEQWCANSYFSGSNANSYTKYGNCYYGCHAFATNDWNIFYSSSGSSFGQTSQSTNANYAVDYFTNGAINTQVHCTYSIQNTGIRKRSKWFYGTESTATTTYFTNNKEKTFNIQKFEYGLVGQVSYATYALSLSFQRLRRHADALRNDYSLTKDECTSVAIFERNTVWQDYQLNNVDILNYQTESQRTTVSVQHIGINGTLTELDTPKLPYGCIASASGQIYWNNDQSLSNFKDCGLFRLENYGTLFDLDNTLTTTLNLGNGILGSSFINGNYYSVTCLEHPVVSCTWQNAAGGLLYEKDLFNFPTTNNDVAYVKSDRRISLTHPIRSNKEDALRYCLDLCDRTTECFYANIGDDHACEMYRKCESTSASNNPLFRKLPFFLDLKSTLSDQVSDYFYDIGVLDNSCELEEPRPSCYLDYCNRHLDIKAKLCDDTCDSAEELTACKEDWETIGINDASRNFNPETECVSSLVLAQTSRDADCPAFCVSTESCSIAYKTEDACYALPQCRMLSGNSSGHVITKIVREQAYHELFPYNSFWPCDAIVVENATIDDCVEEARREQNFIFSYNDDLQTCMIYEHYVPNAYDELMDHGINASWCYSNNVLQQVITSLGTCSTTPRDQNNEVPTLVSGSFKTLNNRKKGTESQTPCMAAFQNLPSTASISLSSNLLSFNNVVDALIACFETVDCNHIIKYTAQNQIVLATTVVAGSGTTMIASYTTVNKNCDLPPSACIDLSLNSIVVSNSGYADTRIVQHFDNFTRISVDCESAAEELGYDYGSTIKLVNASYGCVVHENQARWNVGPFQEIVQTHAYDKCLEAEHCYVGKPEVASDFTLLAILEEVSSGSYDSRVTSQLCQGFVSQISATVMSTVSDASAPGGCYTAGNGTLLYYNTILQGACEQTRPCVAITKMSLETCMVKTHKLGKEAGRHSLGANIDGTGPYTGGTCWYKNSGVLGASIAAPNVMHKTAGFPSGNIDATGCASAATKLGLTYAGTTSSFFKPQGCIQNTDTELRFNDRSTATDTIESEFISVQALQLLDVCQAACQTDDDCIGQLVCSTNTAGCANTEASTSYCVYDGHCSDEYPCIDERCPTNRRRRLMQLPGGNTIANSNANDAPYNEDDSCTRVEYFDTRQIVSFDVFTKENTLGGYVIGATDTMHAITDEHFCRQLDDFASVINDPRKPFGCFKESSAFFFNAYEGEHDSSISLFQAPCTATTPCLKHSEGLFNSTYIVDATTGVSTCYEGSGNMTSNDFAKSRVLQINRQEELPAITGLVRADDCPSPYSWQDEELNDNYKTYVLGSVQYDVGADSCASCFPGHYTSEDGVCLPCQAGRYTSKARIAAQGYMPSCTICEVGRFQNEQGQASCKACDRGSYQNERGQVACKTVESGKFGVGTGAWTGTSGPDQSNTRSDRATFLQGATDQAAECDPDEGYFYNCINQDGSKYRPELAAGQQINEVCPGGNFACERCGSGTRIDNNACVDCEQGFYQDADFAVGNTCKSCTAGEYQDETGQTSCKPTSRGFYQNQVEKSFQLPCEKGFYADTLRTVLCKGCPTGRSASQGQTLTTLGTTFNQLVECFECTAGLFQDEEAKLICKNCAAGKFSEQGSSACNECVPGFYRPTLTSPACTPSSPGYYVDTIGAITQLPCPIGSRSPGIAQTNSLCEMCDPGYFQDVTGQASCKSCAKGYFTSSVGYHRECTPCSDGESTATVGQSGCTPCAAGTYSSSESNHVCEACPSGQYSSSGAGVCTKCPVGRKAAAGNSHTSETNACVDCEIGTYQDQTGSLLCKVCPKGRYVTTTKTTKASDCTACPGGTFLSDDATSAALHDNVDDCKDCQDDSPGTYSEAGASVCEPCPAGNYATKSGGSSFVDICLPCGAGKYNDEANSDCKSCGEGEFQDQEGSTDCKECNAGRQSKADRTQCDDCSAGRFRSNSNLKQACAACAIGKYCGTTGCESCNDVGSNECANAGATEPTQTYRNDCGGIVGDPLCQCESTKACVKCLSYSNRRMDVIAEAEYGSSQVPIDCGTYTFLSESYNECVLGSIAYAFTTVMTLVTDPVCEHYVTSGCRL